MEHIVSRRRIDLNASISQVMTRFNEHAYCERRSLDRAQTRGVDLEYVLDADVPTRHPGAHLRLRHDHPIPLHQICDAIPDGQDLRYPFVPGDKHWTRIR